ncbi:unnamed protein product, partial [Mesorhabditis spiculigera]
MGELVSPAGALSPNNFWEKHVLTGADGVLRFKSGRNVVLSIEETRTRERDCARVRTQIISEYKWERRDIGGNLMDVRDTLIAYRNVPADGDVDAVRVMERESKQRQLIKGFRAPTADVAWAPHTPLLGIVDVLGNLYIYQVTAQCQVQKYLNIMYSGQDFQWESPKISWCGYVPDEDDEELHMVAVYEKNRVIIYNLSEIRSPDVVDGYDTTLDKALDIEKAVWRIQVDESKEITAMSISPDATAVAVAVNDGTVLFYMIENEQKIAQTWRPDFGGHVVSQLFFIDNIAAADKSEEQFWKFCVAVGDSGRRIHLFDCENWSCLGRLRLDSPLQGVPLHIHLDRSSRYIIIVDVDGANIFCVELDYSQVYPKFSAVTQIAFCHPLVTAVPFGITFGEQTEDDGGSTFDDEDDGDNDGNKVILHLCGINYKNLVQLDITVERTAQYLPTIDMIDVGQQKEQFAMVPGPSSSTGNGGGLLQIAGAAPLQGITEMRSQLEELNAKVEKLVARADRAEQAELLRRNSTGNEELLRMMQQFKEEMSLREERLIANVNECVQQTRDHTISTVRSSLNENSLSLETQIQANNKHVSEMINQRVHEKMREAIQQLLVPAIERTCGQLFVQLNEHFRLGIEQYLSQLRTLQQATVESATPAPVPSERQLIVQQLHALLQTGNIPAAFEHALNLADEEALLYVLHQVNPDEFFSNDNVLSQAVLLPLLQQLTRDLDRESDLKFRFMEFVLPAISVYDPETALHVPGVLTVLLGELTKLRSRATDQQTRRACHIISRVAENMLNLIKMG